MFDMHYSNDLVKVEDILDFKGKLKISTHGMGTSNLVNGKNYD